MNCIERRCRCSISSLEMPVHGTSGPTHSLFHIPIRRPSQAEVPPHAGDDDQWTVVADGSRFCDAGFRCYKADAVAAVREGPRSPEQSSSTTERSELMGYPVAIAKTAAAAAASATIAFHHFPIPDLTPADSLEALSELVHGLAALLSSGKVRVTWLG